MGHHRHARIIVNGQMLYNIGGDTCKLLEKQLTDTAWHPLTSGDYELTLGLKRFNQCDVKSVTILIIAVTNGHRRSLRGMHQFWYENGVLTTTRHYPNVKMTTYYNGEWVPSFFDKNDRTYTILLNLVDMRADSGEDMLGWIHNILPLSRDRPVTNTEEIEKVKKQSFLRKIMSLNFWSLKFKR